MNENKFLAFGNRIKGMREQRGIKQGQFADSMGISRQSMSNYESGKHSPDIDVIVRMADYFQCSTDYLLGLTEHPNPEQAQNYGEDISRLSQTLLTLPCPLREQWLDVFIGIVESVQQGLSRRINTYFQAQTFFMLQIQIMSLCSTVADKQRSGDYTPQEAKAANDKLHGLIRLLRTEVDNLDDMGYKCINPPTASDNDESDEGVKAFEKQLERLLTENKMYQSVEE